MDPTTTCCPNLACPARGQTGQDNIGIHARKDRRFLCTQCHKTCSATKGTVFYQLRTSADLVALIITLLAHGCPVQAIVVACGFDERTVAAWGARAGCQGQAVQAHLVEQPRDLGHVQADEIRVKRRGGVVWMALAMAGLHPVVAGWRGQRAARHAVDPAVDRAGAPLCAPTAALVLYRWLVLVHPRDA